MDKPKKENPKSIKETIAKKNQENSEKSKMPATKVSESTKDKKPAEKPKGATGTSQKKVTTATDIGKKGALEKGKSPSPGKPKDPTSPKAKVASTVPQKTKAATAAAPQKPKVEPKSEKPTEKLAAAEVSTPNNVEAPKLNGVQPKVGTKKEEKLTEQKSKEANVQNETPKDDDKPIESKEYPEVNGKSSEVPIKPKTENGDQIKEPKEVAKDPANVQENEKEKKPLDNSVNGNGTLSQKENREENIQNIKENSQEGIKEKREEEEGGDDEDFKDVEVEEPEQKPEEPKPDYSKPIGPVKDKIEYKDIVGIVKDAIQQFEDVDAVNSAFANCKTDAERFKLLYSNPVIYDAIEVEEGYKKKDLETAAKYRTEGNEMFKVKRHVKALELYSLCIINAPFPSGDASPELALGFANRSAVLYHLSHYLLCVQDIKLALKHHYPEKMQYKLYDRLGRCYYYLRQKDDAIAAFETGMEALDNANLDKKKHESLENDMIKQLMKARKIKSAKITKTVKDYNNSHGAIPKLGQVSEEVPVMSDILVLKYSPERGRGIYTTKDIEAGELLIFEKPFASKTMHSSDLTHCQNCLNRVLSPLPCDQCSGVVFCSEECKAEGMKGFHFAECKVLETIHNISFGLGHLALRMVLKAGLNHILQNNKKYPENFKSDILRIGFNKDGVYDSLDYDTVYSLVKHSEKRSLGDLFKRSVVAVFMVKCLEKTLSSQPLSTKAHLPEKCVIGGHILRHIQMLPCNAHEVSEFAYREYDLPNSQNIELGSAIYSTLSLINHSCDPNVVRHSYGDYCAVRAIRNIPKGTEIYDSYGALYPLMPKKDRHEKLLNQYFFKCTCKACLENWPLYFQIPNEVPYFYCEKCSGYLSIPEDGKTQRAMCEKCRYVQDMTPKLDVWTRSDEIFAKKLKEVIGGVVTSDALSVLLGHLKTLDQLIVRPFADYNDCQEAIKQCLNLQANCKKVDLYI